MVSCIFISTSLFNQRRLLGHVMSSDDVSVPVELQKVAAAALHYVIFNQSVESGLSVNSQSPSTPFEERADVTHYRRAKAVSLYVLPAIFVFGTLGNALCVAVFARKLLGTCSSRFGLRDNIELSAASGFFLLSLSDLLLCVSGLPDFLLSNVGYADSGDIVEVIKLHGRVIQPVLLNVWIFTSAWVTCSLSIERYLVITYPLQAKSKCSCLLTAGTGLGIFIASLALNFPSFFKYSVHCAQPDCYLMPTKFLLNSTSNLVYHVIWSLFGCVVPFCILSFANIRLLVALRRNSTSFRDAVENGGVAEGGVACTRRHAPSLDKNSNRRARQVTLILALIVSSYLLLVTPASCLELIRPFLPRAQLNWYRLAVIITNTTQATNFSFGFLLYVCMSARFRRDVRRLASCCTLTSSKGRDQGQNSQDRGQGLLNSSPAVSTRTMFKVISATELNPRFVHVLRESPVLI